MVDTENPDTIGITESWAKESTQNSELVINDCEMLRKDREGQKEK